MLWVCGLEMTRTPPQALQSSPVQSRPDQTRPERVPVPMAVDNQGCCNIWTILTNAVKLNVFTLQPNLELLTTYGHCSLCRGQAVQSGPAVVPHAKASLVADLTQHVIPLAKGSDPLPGASASPEVTSIWVLLARPLINGIFLHQ